MALETRTLVTQLARDAIARWCARSTGLRVHAGDSNETRPTLPYVSFTFPRGRTFTGYRRLTDLTETPGAHAVAVTAALGEPVTLLVNAARVSIPRDASPAPDFAVTLAAAVNWWSRGRATAEPAGDDVLVTPDLAGLLLRLEAIEGATVAPGAAGPARKIGERLLRAACRVEVLGAPPGAAVGAAGDGLDAYAIEEALREGLSSSLTRQELAGAYLRPHGLGAAPPNYASQVSGHRRETRVSWDLELGWTAWWSAASEALLEAAFAEDGLLGVPVGFPESGVPAVPVDLSLP